MKSRLYGSRGNMDGGFELVRAVRTVPTVLRFFLGYVLLIAFYCLLAGEFHAMVVAIQACIFVLCPRVLFSWIGLRISLVLESSIALFIMGTLILGEISHYYDSIWWWDIPFHTMSGLLVTHVAGIVLLRFFPIASRERLLMGGFLSICFLVSVGVSGLWEVYEFGMDSFFNTLMQPNGHDTMVDLFAGVVGAILGTGINYKTFSYSVHSRMIMIRGVGG